MVYTAWRYGRENPWEMWNGVGSPLPTGEKADRLRAFILACGVIAYESDVKLAGGKLRAKRPAPNAKKKRKAA